MCPVKDLLEAVDRARKKRELPNKYPYIPDKTYRCKAWTIQVYETERIVKVKRRDGLTYVISDSTDFIAHLPDYLLRYLRKRGLLKMWKEAQIRKSFDRLQERVTKYQDFLNKRNPQIDAEGSG